MTAVCKVGPTLEHILVQADKTLILFHTLDFSGIVWCMIAESDL